MSLGRLHACAVMLGALLLGGCNGLADLTSSAFVVHGEDQSGLLNAFAHCHAEATFAAAGDPDLVQASPNYEHLAVNERTSRCMARLGYAQHDVTIGAYDYTGALFGPPGR